MDATFTTPVKNIEVRVRIAWHRLSLEMSTSLHPDWFPTGKDPDAIMKRIDNYTSRLNDPFDNNTLTTIRGKVDKLLEELSTGSEWATVTSPPASIIREENRRRPLPQVNHQIAVVDMRDIRKKVRSIRAGKTRTILGLSLTGLPDCDDLLVEQKTTATRKEVYDLLRKRLENASG